MIRSENLIPLFQNVLLVQGFEYSCLLLDCWELILVMDLTMSIQIFLRQTDGKPILLSVNDSNLLPEKDTTTFF